MSDFIAKDDYKPTVISTVRRNLAVRLRFLTSFLNDSGAERNDRWMKRNDSVGGTERQLRYGRLTAPKD